MKTGIKGAASGPLAGRTIAVKDRITVAGIPMMNGSGLLDGFVAPADATDVHRVLEAGGEIVGRTNCEYFCLSGGSHSGRHGPTHNPHRRGYSAGGSSSGSAVVVVTGEADMALGADQAGSIRVPASFCGRRGLRPGRR
ncbi:amidase family protein [Streptantibioticus ferralitis]|uniref:Amidase family protein n=1 Tax=Streptantibioticus ferralitis TaxID=236510 RepID=A0ABT5Z6C8_9ACTN|nr:amidase family protein [Streptantibioticus ferralitis]MDF2259388.1 amidase family protein [Streptantibioticus ferralitis]